MLKQQIKQLEEEKKASDAEDQKQNDLIAAQAGQLNDQEEKLTTQEVKLMTQESEIKSLRRSLSNVMTKLGMK